MRKAPEGLEPIRRGPRKLRIHVPRFALLFFRINDRQKRASRARSEKNSLFLPPWWIAVRLSQASKRTRNTWAIKQTQRTRTRKSFLLINSRRREIVRRESLKSVSWGDGRGGDSGGRFWLKLLSWLEMYFNGGRFRGSGWSEMFKKVYQMHKLVIF